MSPGFVIGLVVGGVLFLLIVLVAAIYNRLVALKNRYLNAYSQIDVQLKRRHDLIPNLVETVKGYMAHERQTLEAVIAARNVSAAANATAASSHAEPAAVRAAAGAESALLAILGRFMVLVEAYPDLKANATTSRLMEELTSTENRVAFARQAYNDAVMQYNTTRQSFPNVMIAGPMGFGEAALFEITEPAERQVAKVGF